MIKKYLLEQLRISSSLLEENYVKSIQNDINNKNISKPMIKTVKFDQVL